MMLKRLWTRNFMPYAGDMTLEFPTERDRNVLLIYGDNMRGKTSLLNALRWAFYGNALGRHSREIHLPDLVNRDAASRGDWNMEARVTFVAEGTEYEIHRSASKRAGVGAPTRSEDFLVKRAVRKGADVMPEHLIDAEINRFVPEQTSRFFLFDGELLQEYESLLIEGSTTGKKIKESIEQALGVPSLIRGREDAQTLLRSAQKQHANEMAKIAGLEKQAERLASEQVQQDSVERDIADLASRLAAARAEIANLDDFIETTERVHEDKQRLVAQETARATNVERQDSLATERLSLVQDAWREVLRPTLSRKRAQLQDGIEALAEAQAERSKKEARLAELGKTVQTGHCASCGQEIGGAERQRAEEEQARLQSALGLATEDGGDLLAMSTELRDLNRLLAPSSASGIKTIDRELALLNVKLTQHDNSIEKLRDAIAGHDTAEIARQRKRRDGLLKEEGTLTNDIKQAESRLEKIARDIAMLSLAMQNAPNAASKRSTKMVQIATALEAVFAKSIERLREDLRNRVQETATSAFRQLTTQERYNGLRINGNYGLSILDEHDEEVPVRSAGAEQIVALSLIDGLARAGKSAGPVVMDTPFGRLDLKHRANILRYLPTTTEQLVLLVHEAELSKTTDIPVLGSRVASVYEIKEVNPRHSRIERIVE